MLSIVSSLLYLLLAIWYIYSFKQKSSAIFAVIAVSKRDNHNYLQHLALSVPIIIQALALEQSLLVSQQLYFSFSLAVAIMAWLAVAIYWCESLVIGKIALFIPLCLFAAFTAIFPEIFAKKFPVYGHGNLFTVHFLVAMAAYSIFSLAAIQGLMIAFMEKTLHQHKNIPSSSWLAHLPPLLQMEAMMFRLILLGFTLLTIVLLGGMLYSESLFARPLRFDHKTVFGIISWLIFANLLVGRAIYGWRGKIAVRWAMSGFVFLILAYIGSRFVLQMLLLRS